MCIADPFNPLARGACLPQFPPVQSQKVCTTQRVTVTLGTSGQGFIAFTPSIASDAASCFYTGATFTGSNLYPLSANNTLTVGVTAATNTSLPYPMSVLNSIYGSNTINGRIVSVGYRISYVGTTSNESGIYYLYTDPDHQNTGTAGAITALGGFSECIVCNVTRDSCYNVIYPISPNETSYLSTVVNSATDLMFPFSNGQTLINGGYYYNISGVSTGVPVAYIGITGQASNSFLVEIITHLEYAGPGASSLVTPTDSDQRGFEIVTAAANNLPAMRNARPRATLTTLMKDGVKEVISALAPLGIRGINNAKKAIMEW